MNQSQKEKFRTLLQNFSTAVLITHAGKEGFRARPMAIAGVDDNCDLWFITGFDTAKVHEIARDTHVQIICQDGWASCICIAGKASLNHDRAKVQELWNPSYLAWFPQGVNDPNIVLIHVIGQQGEYWDNTGVNRLNYVYQTVKAIVTGTTPDIKEGEQHGHVTLTRP